MEELDNMTTIECNMENIKNVLLNSIEYGVKIKNVFNIDVEDIDTTTSEIYVSFDYEYEIYFKSYSDRDKYISDVDSVEYSTEHTIEYPVKKIFNSNMIYPINYRIYKECVTIK